MIVLPKNKNTTLRCMHLDKEIFKREYDVIVDVMNELMDELGPGTSRINNYREFEK